MIKPKFSTKRFRVVWPSIKLPAEDEVASNLPPPKIVNFSNITQRQRKRFLELYGTTQNLSASARYAGVRPEKFRYLQKTSRIFKQQMADAHKDAFESLELEAWRRARDGNKEFYVSEGRVVRLNGVPLIKKTYSDTLLKKLLEVGDRAKYGNDSEDAQQAAPDLGGAIARLADALSRKGKGT